MKARLLVGAALTAAALGSLLLASCNTGDGEPAATEQTEEVASAAPDPEPQALAHPLPVRADGLLPGMVPFRGGVKKQAPASGAKNQSTPICNNPQLSYFGGPLLQDPIIIAVFWTSSVNSTLQQNIGQFYQDVMVSPYWTWLHEFDSVGLNPGTNQAILPGTYGGGFVIQPLKCAPGGNNCHLFDTDLQAELKRQINLGVLPPPQVDCTGNVRTIYMIDFPPNIKLTAPGGSGNSCAFLGFCAYHFTTTYGPNNIPLIYSANMDVFTGPCAAGCGGNATPLDDSTNLHSHELIEAVTDADIGLVAGNNYAYPAGWGDNNNNCGEIADICADGSPGDTITVSGRNWVVQQLWSNVQNKCTSTGTVPPICTGTTISGCRRCSCGDNGKSCTGATPVCETTSSNVLYGACEQCTASSGTCPAGQSCQQSATPAQDDKCVAACVPLQQCPAGDNCGTVPDGCGGTLNCGSCTPPQTCGGGNPGKPNVCGCTPLQACPAGDNCGTVPDGCGGTLSCGMCPAGQTCGIPGNPNKCSACVPLQQCPAGDNCGTVPDGCGGTLSCGTCPAGQTCGGGNPGKPNVCGCTPLKSCPAGDNCGTVPDGCGGVLNCGTCPAGQTCGAGNPGKPNVCGCTPLQACPPGENCGTLPDGCGGTLNCGTCVLPQTCGGGNPGKANVCGCTPLQACPAGQNCGTAPDGCGGVLNCGTCPAGQTCGGGNPGIPNVCGCTPLKSCPAGENCGTAPDGCGGVVNCGTCPPGLTCGGGNPGKPNVCGCTPATVCPPGDNCGTVPDGCGGTLNCGTCPAGQTCGGGNPGKPNVCGCTPLQACPPEDNCGTVPDGCGGVLNCGTCAADETCANNQCVPSMPDGGMTTSSSSSSGTGGSTTTGTGGSTATGTGGSTATGTGPEEIPIYGRAGCYCTSAPSEGPGPAGALLGLVGLAGLAVRRRRSTARDARPPAS
jgi:MYXO-CTERM domain-containing protein